MAYEYQNHQQTERDLDDVLPQAPSAGSALSKTGISDEFQCEET